MKTRLEYLQTKRSEAKTKLSEQLSALKYDKWKVDKLIDECALLDSWIRELKGHYNNKVDDMTGVIY